MSSNPLRLPQCQCGHLEGDHQSAGIRGGLHTTTRRGLCLVNGCDCTRMTPVCICGPKCEMPCWQRLGITDHPCCPGCPPLLDPEACAPDCDCDGCYRSPVGAPVPDLGLGDAA